MIDLAASAVSQLLDKNTSTAKSVDPVAGIVEQASAKRSSFTKASVTVAGQNYDLNLLNVPSPVSETKEIVRKPILVASAQEGVLDAGGNLLTGLSSGRSSAVTEEQTAKLSLALLKSSDAGTRASAANLIARYPSIAKEGAKDALELLRTNLEERPATRVDLLKIAASQCSAEAVALGKEFLNDAAREVRIAALRVISANSSIAASDKELVQNVLEKVWDPEAKVFYAAGPTLVKLVGEKAAAKMLEDIIAKPPSKDADNRAIVSLGECGKEGLSGITSALTALPTQYWGLRGAQLAGFEAFDQLKTIVAVLCVGKHSPIKAEALKTIKAITLPFGIVTNSEYADAQFVDNKKCPGRAPVNTADQIKASEWLISIIKDPKQDPALVTACIENLALVAKGSPLEAKAIEVTEEGQLVKNWNIRESHALAGLVLKGAEKAAESFCKNLDKPDKTKYELVDSSMRGLSEIAKGLTDSKSVVAQNALKSVIEYLKSSDGYVVHSSVSSLIELHKAKVDIRAAREYVEIVEKLASEGNSPKVKSKAAELVVILHTLPDKSIAQASIN